MAASLLIEQESGTYTGQIRHSHDGYYAGDFSRPAGSTSVRASYAERRDMPRARHWWGIDGANPSSQAATGVATGSMAAIPTT